MAQWTSWHVPLSIPENRTQKYQNSPFYTILKLTFLGIFKNEIFVTIFSSKIFVFTIKREEPVVKNIYKLNKNIFIRTCIIGFQNIWDKRVAFWKRKSFAVFLTLSGEDERISV